MNSIVHSPSKDSIAILHSDSLDSQNPPCYHFLFTRTESGEEKVYFWNAILGIRRAGSWFPSEVASE